MLDNELIKEAERNVKSYLQEGLLKKESPNQEVVNTLIRNAKESLMVAEEIFQKNLSDLWAIVTSYYSMFYIANAALLKLGYKTEGKIVHKVTSDALIVYVRGKLKESLLEEYEETKEEALNLVGIKADSLLEYFEFEKNKRGRIQYSTSEIIKKAKAKTSLERAKIFVREIEKLLNDLKGRK